MEEDAADRASQEIKALIRKLHPKDTSHKDRIRRLNKFRNFVQGDGDSPEFYDDDIPLLLLGSAAPAALLGDHPDLFAEGKEESSVYGLLQACGTPSVEHDAMLKRSARHAMALLKFLVCDFVEDASGDLNLFASGFCALTLEHYQGMHLEWHVVGDQRGGAKEDACAVMAMLLANHVDEAGEVPVPLGKSDLLHTSAAQQAFDMWCSQNVPKAQQARIKQMEVEAKANAESLNSMAAFKKSKSGDDADLDDDSDADLQEGEDGLENDKKSKRRKEKEEMMEEQQGPALRWEDSQVYREQQARLAAHQRLQEGGEYHDTVRDSQEAAAELAEREEEKSKVLRKDPLGLKDDDFDLREKEESQVELLEQALLEFQEELRKGEAGGEDDPALRAKKESLELILDGIVGVAANRNGDAGGAPARNNGGDTGRSILPTDPQFDPILFLTLVHRQASYEALVNSMNRLSTDTQNQVKQLQDMVRENFALFLRCADGIDVFNEKTLSQSGPGLVDRLNRLDALAESCSHQAKKSFKPLLDNANEVRKVQSALTVLQRIAPMLQAPYLMRQHVENGRFSAALKAYRRVLVIDEQHCNIELLNHVKFQAAECAREARRELEGRLGQDKISVSGLLDAIRDLGELLELDIPHDPKEAEKVYGSNKNKKGGLIKVGTHTIGTISIDVRAHPPALACLLLQAAHFASLVANGVEYADQTTSRIFEGETLQKIESDKKDTDGNGVATTEGGTDPAAGNNATPKKTSSSNQWKYDVLEARSIATIKAVETISKWLPRLLHVAKTAYEDEKRRNARVVKKKKKNKDGSDNQNQTDEKHLSPFEVVLSNIAPAVTKVVEHAAFCGLGSAPRGSGMDIKMTFGKKSPEKLRALLRSPLPPSQSARVGKELANMVDVLGQSSVSVGVLRPVQDGSSSSLKSSPLDECKTLGENSVMTIERRRCIYAFDICARGCSSRATGSGKFDAEALLTCLRTLSEELTRPDQCASEVEKGCELVIRKCCDGLASYVRDRGDAARLSAVAECADVLLERMVEVVREVGFLTNNAEAVEEVMMEDIMGLEGAMFDEFLESIRLNVASCCRMGWLDIKTSSLDSTTSRGDGNGGGAMMGFPPYLSASLLAIVRTRAQIEQALGNKMRRSEGISYQHIAMATVAEAVAESICDQILLRKTSLKVRQADRLGNELQFLMNTLKLYLSKSTLEHIDGTRRMLCSKAGRGVGMQGDGPDGLAALEDLERLGRVYVLCLGE